MIRNPDSARLRALALEEPEVKQTKYGSIYADSEPMSRAAKRTKNNIDAHFGHAEHELLEQAKQALADAGDRLHRRRGRRRHGRDHRPADRPAAIRPRGLRRAETLQAHRRPTTRPTRWSCSSTRSSRRTSRKLLPEKDITIRLAHAPDGRLVKFVRNSNYFGEWKKGVFAGEDYRAKLQRRRHFPARRLPQGHAGKPPRRLRDQLLAVRRPERQRQDQHHLQGAGPQGPRAVLADPGRRRHALPRRPLPRLRGRRPVHQDRLPQPRRPDSKPIMPASARTPSWRTSP